MRKLAVSAALVGASILGATARPAAQAQQRNPGISTVCGEYKLGIIPILNPLGGFLNHGPALPDERSAYFDSGGNAVSATGEAVDVKISSTDTPANHCSHDLFVAVRLGPG